MLRAAIRALDRRLCRRMGIFEPSEDPCCVLRLRWVRTKAPLAVPQGVIPGGTLLLELHTHNERLPPLPADGPSLAWAAQSQRLLARSLRCVATYLQRRPCARSVAGLIGESVLFDGAVDGTAQRLLHRLGFSLLPAQRRTRLAAFGEPWANLYGWLLIWAYNRAALRHRRLATLRRRTIWISRDELIARWGAS